ncbi:MAG: winged helix-turn-helix transcriptional regulator [Clostridiales bacterium]|nr:winged helix-turn-helix transcriptional regulator [Clostridiales bacterium]
MEKTTTPSEIEIMKMSLFVKVMADSTRMKILFAIKQKPKSVSEIVEIVGATQSAVSHQLSIMRGVNIVDTKRDGNKIYYKLADSQISKILDIVKSHI